MEQSSTFQWRPDSALLVIDVQVGVVADGHDPDGVVQRISELIRHANQHAVPVIYVQHEEPDYPEMAAGSAGWQLRPEIAPHDGEPVIAKRYPDAFADTELRPTLDAVQAQHLVIVGAQSDACIRATTYRAMIDGYDVTLVSDAHTTTDREFEGITIPAAQIVAHVNAATPWILYPGRAPQLVHTADIVGVPATI